MTGKVVLNVRVEKSVADGLKERAAREHTTLSDVAREALAAHVAPADAVPPTTTATTALVVVPLASDVMRMTGRLAAKRLIGLYVPKPCNAAGRDGVTWHVPEGSAVVTVRVMSVQTVRSGAAKGMFFDYVFLPRAFALGDMPSLVHPKSVFRFEPDLDGWLQEQGIA